MDFVKGGYHKRICRASWKYILHIYILNKVIKENSNLCLSVYFVDFPLSKLICHSLNMYAIFFQMAAQGQAWQKDAADQNFDYMFKLLVIGNSSVGKTSFLFRYADDSFTSAFVSTVGIDFKVKTVFRQDKRVKLQIWVSFRVHFKYCLILTSTRPYILPGSNSNSNTILALKE